MRSPLIQNHQKVDRTFAPPKSPPPKSPTLPHKSAGGWNPRLIAKVLSRGLKSKLNKQSSICHHNRVLFTILQSVSTDFSYETGVSTPGGIADLRTNKRPPGQTIAPTDKPSGRRINDKSPWCCKYCRPNARTPTKNWVSPAPNRWVSPIIN